MKFRSIFLAALLGLIASILIAVVVAVGAVIHGSVRRDLASDLERSRRTFEELQGYRASLFRAESRVVSEAPRLKAVVATADISRETILGVAREVQRTLSSDLFIVTDADGFLIVDTSSPAAEGHALGMRAEVKDALEGRDGSGVWLDGTRVYQMVSRRLSFGASTVGALLLGYLLDDRVATTVAERTGSDVVILLGDKAVAASPFASNVAIDVVVRALGSVPDATTEPVEVVVADEHFLAASAPFPGYAGEGRLRYAVLGSIDRGLAPARRLTGIVLFIVGLAAVVAILLSTRVANRLSRPLDGLVDFTKRLAEGALDERTTPTGPAELRVLANAMNRMATDLAGAQRTLAAKERMEKELEIAAKMQLSILPKDMAVQNLEIAARMIPASEVGGDYYDVLPAEDGCWIGIGDVAGHGLHAGLVMLMVQAGLSALSKTSANVSPMAILKVLNGVLFDNIRHRMAQDEHVTLTLMRFHRDGRVTYSGAHEDLVVFRARDRKCETIPTAGTWMGAMEDVDPFLREDTLTLEANDLLVLYSDGVTEARNAKRRQFGLDRLIQQIEEAADERVGVICDRAFLAIQAWMARQDDDITLVVLRYRPSAELSPQAALQPTQH